MSDFNSRLMAMQAADQARPFPGCPAYLVTRGGLVANQAKTAWLRPCSLNRGGYLAVSLWADNKGKTWPVHQLVAITFIGERPSQKHEVAHCNGDKLDNQDSNLAWKTRLENEADKIIHGTHKRKSRNRKDVLSSEQAADIARRGRGGSRGIRSALAREFGVSITHISKIISGERWSANDANV